MNKEEKKMHFILTIVLTAALMLGITAPISQAMDLPQEVKNIVKRGQLRVGVKTDVPGFSVQDLSGNFQGMEVDIAKKLAMRMGLKANNIIYVPVTAKTRGQLVDSGDIDMVYCHVHHHGRTQRKLGIFLLRIISTPFLFWLRNRQILIVIMI